MHSSTLLIAALIAAGSLAHAGPQESGAPAPTAPVYSGWYGGASIGVATADTSASDLDDDLQGQVTFATDSKLQNDSFAWKVYGGYRFDESPWAMELGYIDLGRIDSVVRAAPPSVPAFVSILEDTHPIGGEGVSLGGLYHLMDTERGTLTAKAGLWWWDAASHTQVQIPPGGLGPTVEVDDTGIDPFLGLGGSYRVGAGLHARLEAEAYWIDGDELFFISLGLLYAPMSSATGTDPAPGSVN